VYGDVQETNASWKWLYYAGGASLVAMVVLFRRFFGVELIQFNGFGIFDVPETTPTVASEWFLLFQQDRLLGLVLFGLFDLINYLLLGVVFMALYGALHRSSQSLMLMATALGFTGIAVYAASHQAFGMLSLSNTYATISSDSGRSLFLAAGEALLANHNPGKVQQGTGMYVSFLLVLLAGLLVSIVMLRSTVFNKAAAYTGIIANVSALGYFPALALGAEIVWVFPTVSAPFRIAWYILIAIGLFRLASKME
jgi:hypothetical protein